MTLTYAGLLQQMDFKDAVERSLQMLLHSLYGHGGCDADLLVAVDAEDVADRGLKAVFGLADVSAVRGAELVSEAHRVKASLAGRGTAGDGGV